MKIRLMIFILAVATVLSGCKNGDKGEYTVTLENVTQAMNNKGLKLLQIHPKGGTSPFDKLNDVKAETYAIDTYGMGDVTDEIGSSLTATVNVYIYVFDSEKALIEGREDYNEKLSRAKFVVEPRVFEEKNVLIIHFKQPDEKSEYDEMIDSAVKIYN